MIYKTGHRQREQAKGQNNVAVYRGAKRLTWAQTDTDSWGSIAEIDLNS
jgi:hypothetical protein